MLKAVIKSLAIVCCLGLLIFIVVKVEQINSRVNLLSRPSKQFSIGQIENKFPFNPEWEVKTRPEMMEFINILSQQPFYWLGKGFQASAFQSLDGEYVIKFFHQGRLRDKTFKSNPIQFLLQKQEFEEKADSRKKHRQEIFISSKQCCEELSDETGIVFVHLNRTSNKIKGIKLFDAYGNAHRVRGDDVSFVLQRKANYLVPVFTKLMQENKTDEAKARIEQIFSLLLTCAKKGFLDGDHALIRNNNVGFVADRAIYIDTGHIVKYDQVNMLERMKYEFEVRLSPLHDWLKVKFPELGNYFSMRKKEILASCEDKLLQCSNTTIANENQENAA